MLRVKVRLAKRQLKKKAIQMLMTLVEFSVEQKILTLIKEKYDTKTRENMCFLQKKRRKILFYKGPPLPIARDNLSSGTITLADFVISSISTEITFAGESDLKV